MSERYDLKIVIEHAGPDWVIQKTNITDMQARATVDSACYIAPIGATVTSTMTRAETKK